jgi:hypothetical protein
MRKGYLRRWLLLALALPLTGCQTVDKNLLVMKDSPPTGIPVKVASMWDHEIRFAPDTQHSGAPMPGLAGRILLFDQSMNLPIAVDGGLVVDLYDCTGAEPVMKEEFRIDPVAMKRYLHKDSNNLWGYSLFLPWGTYRPDITKVQLRMRFDPVHGSPVYAQECTMSMTRPLEDPGSTPAFAGNQPPRSPVPQQMAPQGAAQPPMQPTVVQIPIQPAQTQPTPAQMPLGPVGFLSPPSPPPPPPRPQPQQFQPAQAPSGPVGFSSPPAPLQPTQTPPQTSQFQPTQTLSSLVGFSSSAQTPQQPTQTPQTSQFQPTQTSPQTSQFQPTQTPSSLVGFSSPAPPPQPMGAFR